MFVIIISPNPGIGKPSPAKKLRMTYSLTELILENPDLDSILP